MSEPQEIIDDIDILLENSEVQILPFIRFKSGAEISPNTEFAGILEDQDAADHLKFIHKQAVNISKIYFQENKSTQTLIKKYLISQVNESKEIAKTVFIAFHLIGSLSEFLDFIISDLESASNRQIPWILQTLNHLIFYNWPAFSKSDIKKIRSWAKLTTTFKNKLGESYKDISAYPPYNFSFNLLKNLSIQTNIILAKDVEKRIDLGFNPEINEDETRVKEEFSKFGFPSDLSEALDKIDQKLNSSKDAFDFKGTMDLLRSFTERLYRSILDQYGDEGKKIHDQDSEAVSKYFVAKGLVNKDFGNMIASQRHFISNTASHRLKSREEDARLSKNMVIEMSLYILRRLQNN